MSSNTFQLVQRISRRCQSTLPSNIETLLKTPNKYNNKNSQFNFRPQYPAKGGIFFNPAPSAPTPTKTPNAFLPPTDPRKDNLLYNTELKIPLEYMPELNPKSEKKYHMTKEQISELQKLRDQGVQRKELIEKFGISNLFLSLSTDANQELLLERNAEIAKSKLKWSKDKIVAKESKAKRQKMWLRDEY